MTTISNSQTGLYQSIFEIKAENVTKNKELSLESLCNYLAHIAGLHAETFGLSVKQLQSIYLSWVLAKLQIKIHKYPIMDTKIIITTWPVKASGIQFRRDFIIQDVQTQKVLATAVSDWVVIDLSTRKVIRLPEFILQQQPQIDKEAMVKEKIVIAEQNESAVLAKFSVQPSDIDLNQHVNNAIFVNWINQSLPPTVINDKYLVDFQIVYKKEALLGDTIISKGEKQSFEINELNKKSITVFEHSLYNTINNDELVRARTVWQNKN